MLISEGRKAERRSKMPIDNEREGEREREKVDGATGETDDEENVTSSSRGWACIRCASHFSLLLPLA
jgi:hypothetical protein